MNFVLEHSSKFAEIGTFVGAMVAAITLFFLNFRTHRNQLDTQFREFYTFFWDNEKVSKGRKLISYDIYLNELNDTIQLISKKENVSPAPNGASRMSDFDAKVDNIEAIDSFLASITRFPIHGSIRVGLGHMNTYKRVFIRYWLKYILSKPILADYYLTYWCEPLGEKKDYETYKNQLLKQFAPYRIIRKTIGGIFMPKNWLADEAILELERDK